MSNFPTFAQGVNFSIDTTPDADAPSFQPHTPRPPQGRSPFVQRQPRDRFPRGGFTPRGQFTPRGGYAPRGNFSQRGGHTGIGGSHNTPRHFHDRQHGALREGGDSSNQGIYSPRGGRGFGGPRTPRPWTPRQPQQNFSNPYENQLTPRQAYTSRQRWTHTPRGASGPLSSQFGPCAQGASKETLSIIDAFVKPSMLDNPWKYLEQQKRSTGEKQKVAGAVTGEPSYKKVRGEIEPDGSPPPEEDDGDDDNVDDAGSRPSGSGWKVKGAEKPGADEGDDDFNVKDFLPKV